MSKEIEAVVKDVSVDTMHIKATPYGLDITGKPSTEEWYDAFQKVSQAHGMSQFYLGDLVVCAEYEWGDKYTDLIDLTGYDYGTVARYASVARRFPSQFREEVGRASKNGIPNFHSFQMVTSLDDDRAKYFLRMVSDAKWSNKKLEEEVKRYKNGGTLPSGKEEEPVGYKSFKEVGKNLLKGYTPERDDEEYDTVKWLLEIRDWATKLLQDMGVEDE